LGADGSCHTAASGTAQLIYGGTLALSTGTIAAATSSVPSCTLNTVAATGALATDRLDVSYASDWTAVTGYAPVTTGFLLVGGWMTSGQININQCNPTAGSITPGALSVVVGVYR
jgi:ABC-type multidrug transport system permease subunit